MELVIRETWYLGALLAVVLAIIAVESLGPRNGGRATLRLLLYPQAFTWLLISLATYTKAWGFPRDTSAWGIGVAGLVTFIVVGCFDYRIWVSWLKNWWKNR